MSDQPIRIFISGACAGLAEARDALASHRDILRAAFSRTGGRELGTEGDSFFVVFPNAADGVAATAEAQRNLAGEPWPEGVDVRVRMGLHTGVPHLGEEGYTGLDVIRASRISSAGHGGSS